MRLLFGRRIVVFLPAFNEEEGIARVLGSMPGFVDKVVVGNNNSTDGTERAASKWGATVFRERRQGKGFVFSTFLRRRDFSARDIVVMLDADSSYDPREMGKLAEVVANGCGVAMGDRFSGSWEKGAMNRVKEFGNSALSLAARALYGTRLRDLCTGYWAFDGKALKRIKVEAGGFELEAEIFSKARKAGIKIGFCPINYSNRLGERKLRASDGARILARLLANRLS